MSLSCANQPEHTRWLPNTSRKGHDHLPQSPGPGPRQLRWATGCPGRGALSAPAPCIQGGRTRRHGPQRAAPCSAARRHARAGDSPRRQTLLSAELEPPIPERDAWQPHAGSVVQSGAPGAGRWSIIHCLSGERRYGGSFSTTWNFPAPSAASVRY